MNFLKPAAWALCLLPALALTSCEQKPATTAETATEVPATTTPADSTSTALPVVTAAYICPMGCEGSASDQPGKCPVCKMDLEPNPAAKPAATL